MNVLVVCQYYYPEQFQVNDICEQMAADGHRVTVITGLPNYPSGVIPREYRHGKKRDEYRNGVHIIRCFEIGRRKGALWLSLNYLSYCFSATLKALFIKEKYDIVFVNETSPATMIYPAEVYGKRKNVPVYVYCCDIWPECVKTMVKNENSLAYRLIWKLSTYLYRRADHIAVQSKGFFSYFAETHAITEEKLSYLPQFSDSAYLEEDFTPQDDDTVDFVFLGNVGIAQDIDGIIAATDMLRDLDGFKVHIVGDGSYCEKARELVAEKKLEDKIIFYGRRPYEEMPEFYRLADVCLATLQADSVISLTIPSKVQGYMAAGKPIIAALSGFGRKVIEESGAGVCVEPGSRTELADAMKRFIDKKMDCAKCGRDAREYYKKNFTKEIFMRRLYDGFAALKQNWERK